MKRTFEKKSLPGLAALAAGLLAAGLLVTGCTTLQQPPAASVHRPSSDTEASSSPVVTRNRLADTHWQVISIAGQAVRESVRSTLHFDGNSRVFGMAGCNQFNGTYRLVDSRLQVEQLITTRKLCFSAVMFQEESLLRVLRGAQRIELTLDELILESAREQALSRMVPLLEFDAASDVRS